MAAKVTSGVFPVHNTDFEVNTGTIEAPTWVTVAELEEINVEVENNTETWNSFAQEGWQSALVTGKNVTISIVGKRCVGDPGNDYLAGKMLENGQDAYVGARITHPDGTTLEWAQMACGVTNNGAGGAATDVGALECELTSHGKPVVGTKE